MKKNEKLLLALAAGLLTGTVIGILFAPNKGKKTRRLIKEESDKVFDQLCQIFDEGVARFNELKDEIMQTPEDSTAEQKE